MVSGRQDVRAELRDGTALDAAGLVVSLLGMPNCPPCGVMNNGSVSAKTMNLAPGGSIFVLKDYLGPVTGVSPLDCKVVAAFDAAITWETVATVMVGGFLAEPASGTAIFDG